MTRHILITGATGFIGQPLCKALLDRGDSITVKSRRSRDTVRERCGAVDTISGFDEVGALQPIDAVINLAGAGIADKRWTPRRKQEIVDSRVKTTDDLVAALASSYHQPDVLISGSAIGYYGDQGEALVTEETPPNDEFTHALCAAWEQAAVNAGRLGCRVILSRTGLVVDGKGGFMAKMLTPFRMGLGGRLGNGRQFMPWIHRLDMVRGLLFLLDTPGAKGPYNLTAPNPATNAEFTRVLASTLHRPAAIPMPAPVLKVALGEMARLLLTGQQAIPQRLQKAGFEFRFPQLGPALADALSR